jgi:DNA-binding transcriptional MerR regulator
VIEQSSVGIEGVMATKKRAGGTELQPMLDGMAPTPRELGFRGPQVCSIVGITYRQLDYWARTDLVRPSITDAKGSGTQRTYSFQDLVRLKVVKSLLDAGVKLQTARQAIDYLREDLGDDWATANLVLDGTSSVLVRTDDMLIDVVRKGQGVLNIVPLAHVMEELDADVREHVEQRTTSEIRAASHLHTASGG